MSSEVDLLVQSLTASIHSTHFDWYVLRCQVLFWAWERQQWTQTAGLHFPASLAIRCGHVSKSPPGNVSSVLPSRAHRTWLVFPTKSRILTLLGPQNTVCALSNFNLFLPSLTGNQWPDFTIIFFWLFVYFPLHSNNIVGLSVFQRYMVGFILSFVFCLLLNMFVRFIHIVSWKWSSFLLHVTIPLYEHTPPTKGGYLGSLRVCLTMNNAAEKIVVHCPWHTCAQISLG